MRTRMRYAAVAASILVSTALVGCDGGRTRPPQVSVRVMHAAPERGTIDFRREQRSETQLDYRQASGQMRFDEDEYEFNARITEPGSSGSNLLGSFSAVLSDGNEYVFVLTEPSGVFTPIVLENAVLDEDADTRIVAVHAAPSLEPMSVYVEPTGVDPSGVAPIGTLEFGDTLDDATRSPGDYRLLLTEAGNPSNILMRSGELELEAGRTHSFTIVDPTPDSIAPISVVSAGAGTGLLVDTSVRSRAHIINAAADGEPRDIYVDEDFTTPLAEAVPYLEEVYADFQQGERTFSVTPAGNPGTVEAESTTNAARTFHYTILIADEGGDLDVAATVDDRRPIANHARLRFLSAASDHEPLEIFLTEPDADISDRDSTVTLNAPGASQRLDLALGDYELVMRDFDTETIVAGPVPISLEEGTYTVLITNGAAPGTVELVYLEDFE